MVKLEPRVAAKGGMPARIPVPQEEIPTIEKHGIQRERVVPWMELFLKQFPSSPQAPEIQQALDKARAWTRAAAHLKEGRWADARAALAEILALDPADPSAHFNMGAVCRNTGDLAAALDHYTQAEAVFNDEGIFYTNRGRTYQQLGRRKEAIADFNRALQLLPGDEFTLQRLAELGELVEVYKDPSDPASRSFISRADYAKAVHDDLSKHEKDLDYLLTCAHRHSLESQPELTRDAAALALKLNPNDPRPWLYMAVALWQLERYKDALENIKRHLELDPASAVGHTNLAKIQLDLGDREAARAALLKAMELDPNQRHAVEMLGGNEPDLIRRLAKKFPKAWAPHSVLAAVELARGHAKEALKAFEQAIERGAPDDIIAAYLGELGKAGQASRAAEIADSLKDLHARSAELRWNAANAYHAAGRKAEARKILQKMAKDPALHPQWRATAQAALKS
jgi:tetratricopeptide (TPR) repeat protein